jgi:predicted dehydrogenase
MDALKWGIIGVGDVCRIKSGPAFNTMADSKLVGRFVDLCPHQLDLLLFFFGQCKHVSGNSVRQVNQENAGPDCTTGTFLFEGTHGLVPRTGQWVFGVAPSEQKDECVIISDRGSICFNFFGPNCKVEWNKETETQMKMETKEFIHPLTIQQPFLEMVNKYFRAEGPNPCSIDIGIEVIHMIDALNTQV